MQGLTSAEVVLRCPGCGLWLESTNFVPRKTKTGFSTLCKKCIECGKHDDHARRRRVCEVAECFEPVHGVGLCRTHYFEDVKEYAKRCPPLSALLERPR